MGAIVHFAKDAVELLEIAAQSFEEANQVNKSRRYSKLSSAIRWGLLARHDLPELVEAVNSIDAALEEVAAPPPTYHGTSNRTVLPAGGKIS